MPVSTRRWRTWSNLLTSSTSVGNYILQFDVNSSLVTGSIKYENPLNTAFGKFTIHNIIEFENSQDLFYRIGIGTLDNKKLKEFANEYHNTLLNFFKRRVRKSKPQTQNEEDKITEKFDKLVFGKEKEPLAHSFASCCRPIPGDAVFGFITVNEGIKVHHNECPNALSLQSNFAYRVISAKWMDSSTEEYNAVLKLTGIDKKGLVNEVTRLISNNTSVNI